MAAPGSHDITIVKADDLDFSFVVYDVSSTGVKTARNLSGATGQAQVRSQPNENGVLRATMTFASTSTDLSNGVVRFTLAGSITDGLTAGVYYYDMQITQAGKRRTYLAGKFTVLDQITIG